MESQRGWLHQSLDCVSNFLALRSRSTALWYIFKIWILYSWICASKFFLLRVREILVFKICIYIHTCTYLYMHSQGCVSLYGSWNLCPHHKMLVTRVPMWHVCSLSRYECLPEYGAPEKLPTSVFYFKLMLFVSHMDVCMDVLPYSCVTN